MSLFGALFSAPEREASSLFSENNKFARKESAQPQPASPRKEPLEAKSVAQPSRAKDSKPTKVVRKRLKENSAKGSKKRPAEGQAQPAAGVTAKKSKKAETQGDTQQESPSAALTARKGPNSSRRQVLSDDTHVSPEPDSGLNVADDTKGPDGLKRTVFVGNLPVSTKPKTLKALFAQCGTVESVRLRSVPLKLEKMLPRRAAILSKHVSSEMGPSKAYVVFQDESSVDLALTLNMEEVEGHHIRVDRAGVSSKHGHAADNAVDYDRACSIFLGNLPFDATDEEVIRLFKSDVGKGMSVKAVRIIRDTATNIGKGFGYVLFSDKNAAQMALAKASLTLRNRPLRVTRVVRSKTKAAVQKQSAYTGALGAAGRLSKKQGLGQTQLPATAWQGVQTKGKGKAVKAGAAKAKIEAQGRKPQKQSQKPGTDGRKVKRPAVAARKARSLGLPVPAASQAKRKGGKRKN